ncbi:putative GTPase activator protein [Trypanosoma cruzi]|uniref:Putative GTPase activator protein n=1 Tax=Trypanosoma cruzi TaxID=5693 RepID=A0A2V2VLG0_TRYCR|nr:putative GTPase activator protein [Trypanosoma cruzi]RNC43401.1 putative GTPase activator protein [Trypanosoma cruzi]
MKNRVRTGALASFWPEETTPSDCSSGGCGDGGERAALDEMPGRGVGAHAPDPVDTSIKWTEMTPEVFSPVDWASEERLGFPPSSNLEVRAAEMDAEPLLRLAAQRCEKHWQSYSRGLPLLATANAKVEEFMRRAMWHHGIPQHLRGVLWLTISGVASKMDENQGFCRALLKRHGYIRGEYAEAIEKDLHRTFPEHRYFADGGLGIRKARNVLHALCWRNPLLNYCQSFNYLVAFILLVVDDEESTFWLMCHLLENLLPNDLYSESLIGTKVDQLVLQALLQERLPRLAQHFSEVHFEVETLVSAWVMALFINVVPVQTLLRVWDCLLAGWSHSSEHSCVPLEVVLAVLKLHQNELLRCNDAGDVLMCLDHATKRLFDAEKLVRLIREMRLSPSNVRQMRRSARPTVAEEQYRREKRRQELLEKNHLGYEKKNGGIIQMWRSEEKEKDDVVVTVEDPQPISEAGISGQHREFVPAPPVESRQKEYRERFAGTVFVEVNAWHQIQKGKSRLGNAGGAVDEDSERPALSECAVGTRRWRRREESVGLEMESICTANRDQEEAEHQ